MRGRTSSPAPSPCTTRIGSPTPSPAMSRYPRPLCTWAERTVDWDPVAFSYGPLNGTASLQVPLSCEEDTPCPPTLPFIFRISTRASFSPRSSGPRKRALSFDAPCPLSRLRRRPPGRALTAHEGRPLVSGRSAARRIRHLPYPARRARRSPASTPACSAASIHATGTLDNGDKPPIRWTGNFEKLAPRALPVARSSL